MAVWPFNRNKEDKNLPDEIQEYYESGRKQQAGMAWLLALGTLVITVILAILLFFGGRWVYDRFSGEDDQPAEQTQQQSDDGDQPAGQPKDEPAQTNDAPDNQGSSSTNTEETPPAETPTTGPTESEIPSTGPGPEGLQ